MLFARSDPGSGKNPSILLGRSRPRVLSTRVTPTASALGAPQAPSQWRVTFALYKNLENSSASAILEAIRSHVMPEICRFFGIIVRMFFDEHNPPHVHAEYQGHKAVFDLNGNVARGSLDSRTATKLVREWIDLHVEELRTDWELAQAGKDIKKIDPLD
jgi:hypothetical protein